VLCTKNDGRGFGCFGEVWDSVENVETNRTKSPITQINVLRCCRLFSGSSPDRIRNLPALYQPECWEADHSEIGTN